MSHVCDAGHSHRPGVQTKDGFVCYLCQLRAEDGLDWRPIAGTELGREEIPDPVARTEAELLERCRKSQRVFAGLTDDQIELAFGSLEAQDICKAARALNISPYPCTFRTVEDFRHWLDRMVLLMQLRVQSAPAAGQPGWRAYGDDEAATDSATESMGTAGHPEEQGCSEAVGADDGGELGSRRPEASAMPEHLKFANRAHARRDIAEACDHFTEPIPYSRAGFDHQAALSRWLKEHGLGDLGDAVTGWTAVMIQLGTTLCRLGLKPALDAPIESSDARGDALSVLKKACAASLAQPYRFREFQTASDAEQLAATAAKAELPEILRDRLFLDPAAFAEFRQHLREIAISLVEDGRSPSDPQCREATPDMNARATSSSAQELPEEVSRESNAVGDPKPPVTEPEATHSLTRVGQVWQLRYREEKGDYPVVGTKCLVHFAMVLARPNRPFPVGELVGDLERKLESEALFSADVETDAQGLNAIRRALEDVDSKLEVGSTAKLEQEKAELLEHLRQAEELRTIGPGGPLRNAHHNISTQMRTFTGAKLKKDMPQLAAHLKASMKYDFPHVGYYPPDGTPRWKT
jgi:hypothetical protein